MWKLDNTNKNKNEIHKEKQLIMVKFEVVIRFTRVIHGVSGAATFVKNDGSHHLKSCYTILSLN